MNVDIEQLMNAWRRAALHEWERNVRDDDKGIPGDREIITEYFEGVGWGWHVPGGYVERADNPWCGIGQGFCGMRVGRFFEGQCLGVMLDPDLAYYVLPSTRRMVSADRWAQTTHEMITPWKPSDGRAKLEALFEIPRIATISASQYGDKRDEVGGHFVLVEGIDLGAGLIDTIEFNGRGELGDGSFGEGVVRRRGVNGRKVEDLRRVWPFGENHFEWIERP